LKNIKSSTPLAEEKINNKMNFRNLKIFSRLFKPNNELKVLRNFSERKPAPELPTSRGDKQKISGFGKFLFVNILGIYEITFN
jgi:hypothetical protein